MDSLSEHRVRLQSWESLWKKALVAAFFLALCIARPVQAQTTQPLVAIHDSELTRALESKPAASPTPLGPGTTGFEWWPTNWHYFVMPDAVKETLRSDGTAFAVLGDADISAGALLDTNGQPRYPILISLACEAMRDDEIAPLTNYVAAGGFLLVGSSSFTRNPNGTTRGDFAFANELGLHMVKPGLTNWTVNNTFSRVSNHPLVAHIPAGVLIWQMPSSSEETSWPESNHVGNPPTGLAHLVWQVQPGGASVLAQGDTRPYLLVKPFGKGYFIYDAAMQPLIAHGGWAPGMYAYGILRNAIEWAFESARLPVPKLSPWPYSYDAAVIFRHDMEAIPSLINSIEPSAQFEAAAGAKGDYFFCTGELRENMPNPAVTIASLQRAVSNYSATVGPHNGGWTNINLYTPALTTNSYDYWHWGPDEMLDLSPPGYANGQAYASASISNSFNDIQGWIPGSNNGGGLRLWVAPYFNATREGSYQLQEKLGIHAAGEQKLGPFPHWTLSTQIPDKRYAFLTLPVSDWFIGPQIGQALEDGYDFASVHAAVDFYHRLGALINIYSHSSSAGDGPAGALASEYVTYSLGKPRVWSANTASIYDWWLKRGTAQVVPSFITNGSQAITTLAITGASDTNTAVEVRLPSASFYGLQVFTNGIAATANVYRITGQVIKLLVGTTVTNAQMRYRLSPAVQDDIFSGQRGATLTVGAPGVLANDTAGLAGGSLTAGLVRGPTRGGLNLSSNGGFTYLPATNCVGVDSFTYQASDGQTNSGNATVSLVIKSPGDLFFDNLTRATGSVSLAPWVAQLGTWSLTNGVLQGMNVTNSYGYAYYNDSSWTDYSVQARVQFFATNALGGGIGGRLNPTTGAHYAAWIYPEGSGGGSRVLKLIKFEGWTLWNFTPMAQASLPAVGTNSHTLTLTFQGTNITVYFDGLQKIRVNDDNFDSVAPFASGGICADLYSFPTASPMAIGDVVVSASSTLPVIQSIVLLNGIATIRWSTVDGYSYRLQYHDDPTSDIWNDTVPDLLATGPTAMTTNVAGTSLQRFYRVLLLP